MVEGLMRPACPEQKGLFIFLPVHESPRKNQGKEKVHPARIVMVELTDLI